MRNFYYKQDDENVGPVSGDVLVHLRDSGQLPGDTWVRREDNGTWRPLNTIDLSEEEEELRNPSFLRLLQRSGLLWPAVLLAVGLILLLVVGAGLFMMLWPVILVGLIVAWFVRTTRHDL